MNKKLNISFLNQSIDSRVYRWLLGEEFLNRDVDVIGQERKGTWWVNPAMLYLKMYYDKNSKYADQFEWHQIYPCMYHESIVEYPKQIIENKTDILCIGLYTWTTQSMEDIILKIKEALPNIIILVGGPEVAVHNEVEWLLDRPWIDYCVYGDGQEPLTKLLDCVVEGNRPKKDEITNTAWVDDEHGLVVTPNKIFKNDEFYSRGPWWHGRKFVREWVKYAKENGYGLQVSTETSRACPYRCSFCDWNSGLHNKVSKWSLMSSLKDFAFLGKAGVQSFRMGDANFGQWEQDLEIAKFIVKIRKKYGNDVLNQCETNWAKIKKDRAFEIMDLWLSNDMYSSSVFSYSLQDLDPKVLKAIDRPEIPWEEHKAYIVKQREKHPNMRAQAEFISGLPYQTLENMLFNTYEGFRMHAKPIWYPWSYLANAPVRDENYRKKYDVHIHNFEVPFSIVEKNKGEKPNFAEYKLCTSHADGLDEATLCFVFKWVIPMLATHTTMGENSDFLDRLLTVFDNKLYNTDYMQSFTNHSKMLLSGETNKAYIETDEFIINVFHLTDTIEYYNVRSLEKIGGVNSIKYRHLTDKEKIDLIAERIREQFFGQTESTLTAPQIHYAPVK